MINENTTPIDALKIALEEEKKAYALYKRAAEIVTDQSAKKMFEHLAEEETKHIKLIEEEINNHYAKEF